MKIKTTKEIWLLVEGELRKPISDIDKLKGKWVAVEDIVKRLMDVDLIIKDLKE